MHDRVYAIENICKRFEKDSCGLVSLKLFPKQEEIIKSFEKNKRVLVYNGRQTGCSTTILSNLAIEAMLTPNRSIMIVSNKFSFSDIKRDLIIEYIKNGLVILGEDETYIIKNTRQEIKLGNGSIINFVNESVDSFRGYNPDFIFYDNIRMEYSLFRQSISPFPYSKIILTFNPYENLTEYKNITELGFKIIECKWYEDPRYNDDLSWLTENGLHVYDEVKFTKESFELGFSLGLKPTSTWYRQMCKCLGDDPDKIRAELDCEF